MKSSQPNFLSCHYSAAANSEDSTQFNSSALKLISRQAGVSKLGSSLFYNSNDFFFTTTLHGPHGKHRVLLSRIVLAVFTALLHSNGPGADHIENSLSILEACLPRARVYRVVDYQWIYTSQYYVLTHHCLNVGIFCVHFSSKMK
jgi:hypothetical protein